MSDSIDYELHFAARKYSSNWENWNLDIYHFARVPKVWVKIFETTYILMKSREINLIKLARMLHIVVRDIYSWEYESWESIYQSTMIGKEVQECPVIVSYILLGPNCLNWCNTAFSHFSCQVWHDFAINE